MWGKTNPRLEVHVKTKHVAKSECEEWRSRKIAKLTFTRAGQAKEPLWILLNRRYILPSLDFTFEVKQKTMNIFLGPFFSIKAQKHSSSGILFRTILQVGHLTFTNLSEFVLILHLFRIIDKAKIRIQVVAKGIKDTCFHNAIIIDPRPQKAGREETCSLLGKVAAPWQLFLMALKRLSQRRGVFITVGFIMEQGLHIERN